jgi:hypothetical protein
MMRLSGEAIPVEDGYLCVHCFDEATPNGAHSALLVEVSGPCLCTCCQQPIVWEDPEVGEEEYFGPSIKAGEAGSWGESDNGDWEPSTGACAGEEDRSDEEPPVEDLEPALQPMEWWAEDCAVEDTASYPDRPPVTGPLILPMTLTEGSFTAFHKPGRSWGDSPYDRFRAFQASVASLNRQFPARPQ